VHNALIDVRPWGEALCAELATIRDGIWRCRRKQGVREAASHKGVQGKLIIKYKNGKWTGKKFDLFIIKKKYV
jgi:hypothetical protein